MVCHKIAPMTFKNQYSGFLHVQVTEWVNGFLWIILGLYLLIESSLVRLQRVCISHLCAKRTLNGSCCCWNFCVNLLVQMRTDYSRPVISLLVGPHYRATQRVFDKRVFQFVSVCLQSSWVPALRESSCLSGTVALFFSNMWAKTLRVAPQ